MANQNSAQKPNQSKNPSKEQSNQQSSDQKNKGGSQKSTDKNEPMPQKSGGNRSESFEKTEYESESDDDLDQEGTEQGF